MKTTESVEDFLTYTKNICKSNDNLERVDSVELFTDVITSTVSIIGECLNDEDELVQVSAIEALMEFSGFINKFKLILRKKLSSESWLVRAYAIEALGDMQDTSIKSILHEKINDAYEEELPRIYYALVKLGDNEYLNRLFELLNHDYYRVRIATANLLDQLRNNQTNYHIIEQIKKRFDFEQEQSVKFVLNDILNTEKEI